MAKTRRPALENDHSALLIRVARLEGQVAALRRMIGDSTDWSKMLTLAAAI